jgi:hypothetical protein
MLKKVLLIGSAMLLPLGVANAKKLKTDEHLPGTLVCLTDKNCRCNWDYDWGDRGDDCWCWYKGLSGRDLKGHGVRLMKGGLAATPVCPGPGAPPLGADSVVKLPKSDAPQKFNPTGSPAQPPPPAASRIESVPLPRGNPDKLFQMKP